MRKLINHYQKAQVAFAALRGDKTITQLASEFQVHPVKIEAWRDRLRKEAPRLFAEAAGRDKTEVRIEQLQKIIGQRQEEIDWLKKKLPAPAYPQWQNSAH